METGAASSLCLSAGAGAS
ncbi:Protein CBG25490 [Caenorhabditis briggsae]|uniref:Protein CBG25490 n=1 Tax=Caenorhabditis briggsae TaxID=6238 RepID=B6IIW5_CAEBR|nr:Protein CBG25490 [Caenorhabditis briggsae]CAR99845.1 Protein CBG25490 [Caenorhabditis briggsae]